MLNNSWNVCFNYFNYLKRKKIQKGTIIITLFFVYLKPIQAEGFSLLNSSLVAGIFYNS